MRTVRVTLPDGRWLRMHMATVNQQLEILDLPEANTVEARRERVRFWRDTFRDATVETPWSGDVGDGIALDELVLIANLWLNATEEDAVPLASGSSGATRSSAPSSLAPTASPRRSRSRRSSSS